MQAPAVARSRFLSSVGASLFLGGLRSRSAAEGGRPDDRPGDWASDLFEQSVRLHFPTENLRERERKEFDAVAGAVEHHVVDFLRVVGAVLGRDPVVERIEDVAKHNVVAPGTVPMVFVPREMHPHIVLPGIPYTGIALGRRADLTHIAAHEMAHVLFGKFNDALTEPVANLFVRRPSPGGRRGPAGPTNGGDPEGPRERERRLDLDEAILLAVLDLFEEDESIADLRSIEDMFSHVPSNARLAAARYRHELSVQRKDAAKRTNDWLRTYYRIDYTRDFDRNDTLDLSYTPEQKRAVDDWVRREGRHALGHGRWNPHESRGIVRSLHGLLDGSLTRFLIRKGIPPRTGRPLAPATAREALRKLLVFYFDQPTGLRSYGYGSFADLQVDLRDTLLRRGGDRVRNELAWHILKKDLVESSCFRPNSWDDAECESAPEGPNREQAIDDFQRTLFPRGGPADDPDPNEGLSPVVHAAQREPVDEPLLSIRDFLGRGLDFDTYFSRTGLTAPRR